MGWRSLALSLALVFAPTAPAVAAPPASRAATLYLEVASTYATGTFNIGAARAVAYLPAQRRLLVVNAATDAVDVLDIANPARIKPAEGLPAIALGDAGSPTFVTAKEGLIAIVVEGRPRTKPGSVRLYNRDGNFIRAIAVGAGPGMAVFTPDGRTLLVANEGAPEGDIDPEGSVSVIDLGEGVGRASATTIDFGAYNLRRAQLKRADVHFVATGRSVAQDLEPQSIALAPDGKRAYVSLQENNALAVLDVERRKLLDILGLGVKDFRRARNRLDASDLDGKINIRSWPVFGLYQPDGLAVYRAEDRLFLITVNEGERRPEESARVADVTLDPKAFRDRDRLQRPENLGRLFISKREGDRDDDGDFDALYTFGGRSFAIWTSDGRLVWDSGDALEQLTAKAFPRDFNSRADANHSFDRRSDLQGPQPRGIALGRLGDRAYVFVGLSQIGGVVVYDVTEPAAPRFVEYVNNRDFEGDPTLSTAGDLGPYALLFIAGEEARGRVPLLVVTNEVSGTTTLYRVLSGPPPGRDDGRP